MLQGSYAWLRHRPEVNGISATAWEIQSCSKIIYQ
jgi:hypothetical protein